MPISNPRKAADTSGLLLDTHIWLWYAEGVAGRLSPAILAAIDRSRIEHRLHVNAVSVWEVGMLCAKEKSVCPRQSVNGCVAACRCRVSACKHSMPKPRWKARNSPADRFLIAAARVHGLSLVTADKKICPYGKAGHVQVLPA